MASRNTLIAVGLLLVSVQQIGRAAENLPYYLHDRGNGVTTSLFGTFVEKGEILFYPFYEYVDVSKEEYHGSELGFSGETDYLGKLTEHEIVLFFAYGFTDDLAIELEGALYQSKKLEKAVGDTTSGIPDTLEESGLGDVEAQLRWRIQRETANRPELFVNFEVSFPFQRSDVLIGVQDWEFAVGIGFVKGFSWGTLTPRIAIAYDRAEDEVNLGEYAIEYLKKLSDTWRWVSTIEVEDDDASLILEAQWHFKDTAFWKFNSGFGLTEKAADFAPEIGVLFTF